MNIKYRFQLILFILLGYLVKANTAGYLQLHEGGFKGYAVTANANGDCKKQGGLITEGSLLTSVSDIHAMHVYFKISEKEYLNYLKNKQHDNSHQPTAMLILADGTVYKYPGKIETMEGKFDKETGFIAFRAVFPNPAQLLKHGARGKIVLTSAISKVLMIPQ